MKTIYKVLFCVAIAGFSACGNKYNDQHTHYIDSSGMNGDENTGAPNTSTAPTRNVYPTDTESSTNGPDNAVPKSSAMDSTTSIQQNR
jgi:hypothetical protein